MNRRGLVTGGAGFIGSHVVRVLLGDGWDVRVLDNFFSSTRDDVPDGAELVEGDIRDSGITAAAARDVDVVFHQAAVRSVPRSVDEPALVNDVNVTGTLNVLLGAEAAGVRRVVYASSSSVYGDGPTPQSEDQAPRPLSPYAVSKLAGEQYCRVWSRLGRVETVSLRYFNVFGPGQRPESKYAAVFPAFVDALVNGRAPEVHWDGEQSRDFTYVEDVARANLRAGDADADGEVFNVAGGEPRTVNEVLGAVSDAVGTWIEPERTPMRAGDVRATHADVTRVREGLGWEPQVGWEEAVSATVGWFVRA